MQKFLLRLSFLSNPYFKQTVMLLLFMLICGVQSLLSGQDAIWDLMNYHLYIPYAFLTGRFYTDIMPAGIHTYLNPLLDVPYYILVKYLNNYPKTIAFITGSVYGIFIFLVYKICSFIFSGNKEGRTSFAWIALFIGVTGTAGAGQIGISTNEVTLAVILALSFYLLIKFLFSKEPKTYLPVLAALLAGAACGLKYTAAPFAIALTAMLLVNIKKTKNPIKIFILFALGAIVGFLVTNGYFMWRLYDAFGNPVFPFFNEIFKSPYFELINFDEVRFYPQTLTKKLFYPFFWALKNKGVVSEVTMADPRWAAAFISFFIVLWGCLQKNIKTVFEKRKAASLLTFIFVFYILWLSFYSTLRYAVILEAFTGILIIYALSLFFDYKKTVLLGLLAAVIILWGTLYPDWRHAQFAQKAITTKGLIDIEDDALVLLYGAPNSFVVPFLNPSAKFIGGIKFYEEDYPQEFKQRARNRNSLPQQYYNYKFDDKVKTAVKNHPGPIYIVGIPWPMMLNENALGRLDLTGKDSDCHDFDTNINLYSPRLTICKVYHKK